MAFIRSQLLSVIEWKDDSKDIMVYRFPMEGKEIMNKSKLTVRESQQAIFVHKGQIADIFEPGYYALETANLPVLTKIMSWKTGFNSPFKAEVYFVNTRQFTDMKWGTVNPIMMRDPELGVVRIRGFGKFSFRVFNPELLLKELFGTASSFKTSDVIEYLKSLIIQDITDTLAELRLSALDLTTKVKEVSTAVARSVDEDFKKMGLKLERVVIENISVPEEVEKMMDKRTQMGLIGGSMGTYMQYQAANAMGDAARNPGAGGIAGMGIGRAFGDAFSSGMAGQPQGQQQSVACPHCQNPVSPAAKFCPSCGKTVAVAPPMACPKCKAAVSAAAKFCPSCGMSMAEGSCGNCGAKMSPGAKFCPECGQKA